MVDLEQMRAASQRLNLEWSLGETANSSMFHKGGVYRYHEETSGQFVGGHCVQILGGESRELSLASLGTAGFVWTHELEGDDGILRLTRRRGRPEEAGPVGRSTTDG